jgi:hypothetical protein
MTIFYDNSWVYFLFRVAEIFVDECFNKRCIMSALKAFSTFKLREHFSGPPSGRLPKTPNVSLYMNSSMIEARLCHDYGSEASSLSASERPVDYRGIGHAKLLAFIKPTHASAFTHSY